MIEEYKVLLDQSNLEKKSIQKKLKGLKKLKKGAADNIMHELHEEAFQKIDCLKCANCCKTTGPLLKEKDIARIAKHKRMKPGEFVSQFLQIDEDQDYVFKQMPCTFLGEDHYCSIYDVRPKACREYPHTDRKNQQGILNLTQKNALLCPAVAWIFKEIDD